jgi:hypothetical protein
MIDYGEDEPLIDHKGRSRPLYKPRTPRPNSWRPGRLLRIVLGWFPGARVMALESTREGAPYAALGLLALISAIFLMIGFSRTAAGIHQLLIDDRWVLAHAAGVVVMLMLFEILRLAAFFEERTSGLRAPRILAAFLLPSCAILIFGPDLVALWPQLVESAWFAALVLCLGAIAGSVWCAFEGALATPKSRAVFRVVGMLLLAALALAGFLTEAFGAGSLRAVAGVAQGLGFKMLPEILASVG